MTACNGRKQFWADPGKWIPCPNTPTMQVPTECTGCGDKAMWPMCQTCYELIILGIGEQGTRFAFCTECPDGVGNVLSHEPVPL